MGFAWLQRTAKDLLTPKLVFVKALPSAGGYFYRPRQAEIFVDEKYYSLRKGLLLVVEDPDDAVLAHMIAHEWRHYWQWFNLTHQFRAKQFNIKVNYRQEIQRFFKHPRELDALLFSHKVAPCWVSELWLSWVQESKNV